MRNGIFFILSYSVACFGMHISLEFEVPSHLGRVPLTATLSKSEMGKLMYEEVREVGCGDSLSPTGETGRIMRSRAAWAM